MKPINVMVNGIPGKVAALVAAHIKRDERFALLPYSLTGPEITDTEFSVENFSVRLLTPSTRVLTSTSNHDSTATRNE